MDWRRFLGELKRRNVYRVAITYTVVSWVLIQIATQVFPFFEIPTWAVRVLVLLLVLGFPVALIFAWAFELTPEGIKRTEEVPPDESIRRHTGRKLLAFAAVAAAIAIGLYLVPLARRSWTNPKQDAAPGSEVGNNVPEKSIAVLPFNNLSAAEENRFFADAIQDEILGNLAKVADLKVISRTSVMAYKADAPRNMREIGRQLGVAHVLEGSVQRTKNRVRVSAQLIDARTDEHQWAQKYDRELTDGFALQTEIAEAIAAQLQAKLSPREKAAWTRPTHDIETFDLYLEAKELIKTFHNTENWKETLLKAVRLLDEAIARDPKFALAYCWRTRAHDSLYWNGLDRTAARMELAQASAEKALALEPDLGDAHLAQALVYYHGKRDYKRASEELALANRTLPNNDEVSYLAGTIARRQGRWDDAVRHLEKAVEIDPIINEKIVTQLSVVYDFLRRYDDEVALFDRLAVAKPSTRNYSHLIQAQIELQKGELKTAQSFLNSLPSDYDPDGQTTWTRITLALFERDTGEASRILAVYKKDEMVGGAGKLLPVSYWHGMIARAKGDNPVATEAFTRTRATIEDQLANQPADALLTVTLGLIDAGLGRKEEALREGKHAVELRPLTEDALDGSTVLCYLAMIYAWVGDANSALDQLEFVARIPSGLTYGALKYDPAWDPVRNDPRFTAVLTQLQPRPKEQR
jgi:TolB-like protein/Tfp pilus assembly protein PilF